jgi:hypothetical protein
MELALEIVSESHEFPTFNACRQALKRSGARLPQAGDSETN